MNLEEVNSKYGELKQKIGESEKRYEQLKENARKLQRPYYQQKYKLLTAQENGDQEGAKKAQEKLDELQKQMSEIKAQAIKQKEIIANAKTSIENKIERIKSDPEICKQIDKALTVRYERQVNKLTKEKAEIVGKKSGLTAFKDFFSQHPSLTNNLKGILSSTESIKNLEDEIKENKFVEDGVTKFVDIDKANNLEQRLAESKEKLQKNMTILNEYCDRNNINKEEVKNYIGMLVDNGVVKDGKDQINVNATFDRNIKKLDRQINGYDKRIKDYSMLRGQIQNNLDESEMNEIKWWQFGKRLKNWWILRKRAREPQQLPPPPSYQTKEAKEERKTFNDNLKYDIVRDVMNNQQTEDLKFAKGVRKQEMNNDREEER